MPTADLEAAFSARSDGGRAGSTRSTRRRAGRGRRRAFCRTLFDDPELAAGELVTETWSGAVGRFEDPGLLVNFSATPAVVPARSVPVRRAHPRDLMLERRLHAAEIDALAAEGACSRHAGRIDA